jgi:hypothetical protein
MPRRLDVRNRLRIAPELLEQRVAMAGAPVVLSPGAELQTNLPISGPVTYAGSMAIVRDVHGAPIDFNDDGFPDLVNLNTSARSGGGGFVAVGEAVSVLLADAEGRFRLGTIDGASFTPDGGGGAVVDADGDGDMDIVTVSRGEASLVWKVYANEGRGAFRFSKSQDLNDGLPPIDPEANILCMADFDRDGALDLVAPAFGGFRIYFGTLGEGKWNGLFDAATSLPMNVALPVGSRGVPQYVNPVAADFNRDGAPDIATVGPFGAALWINDGTGRFPADGSMGLRTANQLQALYLAVGDFDGDGRADIAAAPSSQLLAPNYRSGPISVFLNRTPGRTSLNPVFAPPAAYGDPLPNYGQIVVSDMNLDGAADLVVAHTPLAGSEYSVFTGDGAGRFDMPVVFTGFTKTNSNPSGISLGDWNRDGLPDVAMGAGWDGARNASRESVGASVGISVNRTFRPLAVVPTTLPVAALGEPYQFQLGFEGGDPSLGYAVAIDPDSGRLPPGLTLSSSGLIRGTPTRAGHYRIILEVTQPNGLVGRSEVRLVVLSEDPTISPATLKNGVVGVPYAQQFSTTGGEAVWSVAQGALPEGLALSAAGLLEGTPTAAGTYAFRIMAEGAGFTASQDYSMTILAEAAPIVTGLSRYGFRRQATRLVIAFSQEMDPVSAQNLSNYVLLAAGEDRRFGSTDDRVVPLRSAFYDVAARTTTLNPQAGSIRLHQLYRLTVVGTSPTGLKGVSGVFLGGQGIGEPGTNYVTEFDSGILAVSKPAPRPRAKPPIRRIAVRTPG